MEGNPITKHDPGGHASVDQSGAGGGCSIAIESCLASEADNVAYMQALHKTSDNIRTRRSGTPSNTATKVYNWLNSTVGYWIGGQDYYTIGGGYNLPFGVGVQFSLTVTPDAFYATNGIGFGSPGPSVYVAGGNLLQSDPSASDIDQFVSGPSLVGGGAPGGIGVNGVWGDEGQLDKNAAGFELIGGMKQWGVFQTNSVNTSDPQFWSEFLGPVIPTQAS